MQVHLRLWRDGDNDFWNDCADSLPTLCASRVADYFAVGREVKRIEVVLSDRKPSGRDWARLDFVDANSKPTRDFDELHGVLVDGSRGVRRDYRHEIMTEAFDESLKLFMPAGHCYVWIYLGWGPGDDGTRDPEERS